MSSLLELIYTGPGTGILHLCNSIQASIHFFAGHCWPFASPLNSPLTKTIIARYGHPHLVNTRGARCAPSGFACRQLRPVSPMQGLRGRSAVSQRRGGAHGEGAAAGARSAARSVTAAAPVAACPIGNAPVIPSVAAAPARRSPLARQQQRRQPVPALKATAEVAAESKAGCPRGTHWQVHKFGGTCMATAQRIHDVAKLVLDDPADSKVVVVSAMGSHPTSPVKVTDLLLNMIKRAAQQDDDFLLDLGQLQEKHLDAAKQLLGTSEEFNEFVGGLVGDIANLKAMLQAMSIGACAGRMCLEHSRL